MLTETQISRLMRGAALATLAAIVCVIVWPGAGHGQFLDCRDIERDGRDQIVVGDIGISATISDRGDAAMMERRLHMGLRQQLAELASSPEGIVHPVLCPGHRPHKSDYTPRIVERRYGSGVLVELWGVASATEAAVTYAVLPLLHTTAPGLTVHGFYQSGYVVDADSGIDKVFVEALELRAFTALSAGLRSLSQAESTQFGDLYDHAYQRLCHAYRLLDEAERRSGSVEFGPLPSEWAVLRGLALEQAGAARSNAAIFSDLGTLLADPPDAGSDDPPDAGSDEACAVPPTDPPPPATADINLETR